MKGYYVFAPLEVGCVGSFSGVEKKIRSQQKVLNSYFDTELLILTVPAETGDVLSKLMTRVPFFPVSARKWKYQGEYDGADFIYMRQVRHDYPFVRYLKQIKKHNPNIKIIYEIPTYPYEFESRITPKNCHVTIKDRLNRRKLKKYVDRIVTFYDQEKIFGIPTIKLQNGFDFSALTINDEMIDKNAVHIIEVSTTASWHGYDRMIEGLYRYYSNGGQVDIKFHMVGDPLPELVDLVHQYLLEDHVIFHGRQSGEALDQIYNQCVLGIDVLGGHRKDYPISSSLKSREYAAKGLPLVTSSPVDYMDEAFEYQLVIPYDDSPVDISTVIDFLHKCYRNKDVQEIRYYIRNYAKQKCDMQQTMLPLINYLQNK